LKKNLSFKLLISRKYKCRSPNILRCILQRARAFCRCTART